MAILNKVQLKASTDKLKVLKASKSQLTQLINEIREEIHQYVKKESEK